MTNDAIEAQPVVTIVTPCYNAAAFIERTIRSVQSQDFPAWEHIVVDDGSTDGSDLIVAEMAAADNRLQLVSQANAGVHAARNNGVAFAAPSSRYLVFLDADDILRPVFLSTMFDHMERYPEVGMTYGSCDRIDSDDQVINVEDGDPERYVRVGVRVRTLRDDELETPLESLVSRHEAIPSSGIFRRDVYERTAGWRPSGVLEDKDMVIQIALQASVHHLPQRLTAYRQHDSNRSSSGFYESMDELHRRWWSEPALDDGALIAVRRAITFDKRISARFERRRAVNALRQRRPRAAAVSAARSSKRYLDAMVLWGRKWASQITPTVGRPRTGPEPMLGEDGTDRYRVLAIHLTKPSNSEASVLSRLLDGLDERIEVELVINRAGDDDDASHLHRLDANPNVHVQSIDIGLPADPWKPESRVRRMLARSTHRLRRHSVVTLARRAGVDLVYTSQQRFDCQLGDLVSRRLGLPHVVHLHYNPGPWLRRPVMRRLVTCDQVIAISEFIAAAAVDAGCDPRRVRVITNTVDVLESTGPAHVATDGVVVGQVGRMAQGKGFPETVEAFALVHAEHSHTSLLLVGDGPDRNEVDAAIEASGVAGAIRSVGWQEDVGPWLEQIDVFVHPSRGEPFGLAVLEAMARAIPVVAYCDGGVAEVVDNGITGLLVKAGDVDGLAAEISRLVGEGELRAHMGEAGRRRAIDIYGPASARAALAETIVTVIDGSPRLGVG